MWISGQQKRPAPAEFGQTGLVTVGGEHMTVRLEGELSPVVFGPAGYQWMPNAGDRVLVIKNEGERPWVVGVQQGTVPRQVTLKAGTIALEGNITVNGVPLEDFVRGLGGAT